jgi:hypothetical protein
MNSRTSGLDNLRPHATSVRYGKHARVRVLGGREAPELLRASDADPSWAKKLPPCAAEIRRIFTAEELFAYFAMTTRV